MAGAVSPNVPALYLRKIIGNLRLDYISLLSSAPGCNEILCLHEAFHLVYFAALNLISLGTLIIKNTIACSTSMKKQFSSLSPGDPCGKCSLKFEKNNDSWKKNQIIRYSSKIHAVNTMQSVGVFLYIHCTIKSIRYLQYIKATRGV